MKSWNGSRLTDAKLPIEVGVIYTRYDARVHRDTWATRASRDALPLFRLSRAVRGRGTGWYFPSYEFTATDMRRAVSLSSIGFYLYLVAENISDRCQRSDRRYPTDGSNVHVRVTCVHASHLSTSSSRMRAVPRTCFTVWYLIRLILANGKYLACFR